jgi:hypothetical protein
MSLTIKKTALKARITEAALNGLPMSANFANEICDLLDANTKSTIKMNNEFNARQTEIEKELFGYDRKGRLNPVSADPEALKAEDEPTQAEAANDENFDCGDCTACKPALPANVVHGLDLQTLLDTIFAPKLTPVSRVFMGQNTLMMIKR